MTQEKTEDNIEANNEATPPAKSKDLFKEIEEEVDKKTFTTDDTKEPIEPDTKEPIEPDIKEGEKTKAEEQAVTPEEELRITKEELEGFKKREKENKEKEVKEKVIKSLQQEEQIEFDLDKEYPTREERDQAYRDHIIEEEQRKAQNTKIHRLYAEAELEVGDDKMKKNLDLFHILASDDEVNELDKTDNPYISANKFVEDYLNNYSENKSKVDFSKKETGYKEKIALLEKNNKELTENLAKTQKSNKLKNNRDTIRNSVNITDSNNIKDYPAKYKTREEKYGFGV